MAENIELHSFCISTTNDSGIEEYHEIKQESIQESVSPAYYNIKEKEFFTEFDVIPVKKPGQKKKKSKNQRKEQAPNLMDIISSELACATVPITENIIRVKEDERSNFLVRVPSLLDIFGKDQPLRLDSEYGWRRKPTTKLSPIFPSILENAAQEHNLIPVQYIAPVSFDDFILENHDDETNGQSKFLDFTIKNIKFSHHHSFSLEKLLSAKLVGTHDEYNMLKKLLRELSKDIRVNRETRDKLRQELLKISPSKTEDIRFDQTVRKYTCKLLQLKEQQKDLLKKQKRIIHEMISLWSDIEMIREKQSFATTPFFLHIITRDLDEQQSQITWNEIYNVEFTDLLDKVEYDYVTKYLEYKESKKEHEQDNAERKKINKPKLEINEEILKEIVDKIVNSLLSRQEIEIFLKEDNSFISPENKELETSKHNYQFEFYVDNVFVCKSERYRIQKDFPFDVEFEESFSVQILPKNQTMFISLLENEKEVSSIDIDLSKISQNYGHVDFIPQKMVYSRITKSTTNTCIGSGNTIKEIAKENKVRLKSSNIFVGNLHTIGEILIKIGWNEKLSDNQHENVKKSMEIGRKIKRLIHGTEKPNIDTLRDIIAEIYGKDITNDEKAITTLQSLSKAKVSTETDFPIDENSPEFIRLKLLRLRSVGGFTYVENKLVPFHASQISTEQLNCLQRSKEKDIDIDYIHDKYADMDPIEMQRFIGCKYVQKLNSNMLTNLHDHLMRKTHKDVVRDYRDLSIRNFFSNQSNLTTIASIPKSTKQQYLNDSLGTEQEIQVTVLRAFNLMDRSSTILSEDNNEDGSTIAGFKVRPLRPFVRLNYRGLSAQTATAIGCHPTWNQTVKIKTKLPPMSSLHINLFDEYKPNVNEGFSEDENYSSKSLRGCSKWLGSLQVPLHAVLTTGMLRGTFKITTPPLLFGYEILQNKDTTYTLIPEVTQLLRKETSFITLQISTSLSHLGGLQGYNQPIPGSIDDDSLIKHLNTIVTEYTNDFPQRNISLTFIDSAGRNVCVTQFLQPIPLPDYAYFPKNPKTRAESALSKSSGLSKSSSSKSSGGRRKTIDAERTNQSPEEEKESVYSGFEGSWKGENQLGKMMNAGLRLVALIPTYEVAESHVVSLMGLELLKVMYGSPLDHTILLASYFFYLGIKCWVVVGHGIPRGQSSFVLTKYDLTARRDVLVTDQLFKSKGFLNKRDGYLWNVYDATSGERFELRDVSCPLKTVDYVFDNENIWLNIQNSQDCESVSFDLTKSSNWMPVFDKTIFVLKQPLVTDSSLYSAPPDITSLRGLLEGKIKVKVQKWRSHLKTIWNRYCSSLLREVLPLWEYWTFNPSEQKPGLSQRMRQLMITYKLFGFPLNMPYVNLKSVVSTVKATGLHVNDDPNVEFGLAVEVYAYPNNVLSVWVFLASITRI